MRRGRAGRRRKRDRSDGRASGAPARGRALAPRRCAACERPGGPRRGGGLPAAGRTRPLAGLPGDAARGLHHALRHRGHAGLRHASDPDRAGGRGRVPLQALQHRRGRPALPGRDRGIGNRVGGGHARARAGRGCAGGPGRRRWRDATVTNFPQGQRLPEAALLPQWGASRISLGLAIGVAAALAVWVLLARTRFGFQLRVFGDSPAAARYAGIPVRRTTVAVLLLSGALAGLAGASEVAGRTGMLDPNGLAVGFGYTGIIVAALARYNPVAVPGVALLIGGLQNAGTALQLSLL